MLKNKRIVPGSFFATVTIFLLATVPVAAGPDLGAPGVTGPARPGPQNAVPARLPAFDPKNCPTCLQNGTKTRISGNSRLRAGYMQWK